MKDRKVLRSFAMISQIGISMMVPIFLCGVIGRWLTRLTHQELWFVFLLVVGIGAAFRNVYIVTRSFYAKDLEEEHKRMQHLEELKSYHKEHPEEEFKDVMEPKKKRYGNPTGPTRH